MQRHVNQLGTVQNFKLRLTSCMDEQGMQAIEVNMDDIFLSEQFLSFLPKEKCLAYLCIDGVATDERLNLVESQISHQVTGLCRHCVTTTLNTFADAQRIENDSEKDDIHFVKEAEVFCIGLNHGTFISFIPVFISPTCKKDDVVQESTDTVREILSTTTKKWYSLPISKKCIFSTCASDGAPQFRKAVSQVLNKDLPKDVHDIYISSQGEAIFPLLNLVGESEGATATCDNNHLVKLFVQE